jgi:hypothetical protein
MDNWNNLPLSQNVDDRRPATPHGRALATFLAGNLKPREDVQSPMSIPEMLAEMLRRPGPYDADINAAANRIGSDVAMDKLGKIEAGINSGHSWMSGLDKHIPFLNRGMWIDQLRKEGQEVPQPPPGVSPWGGI